MTANFRDDLKRGQKSELLFKARFPMPLEQLSGRDADFKIVSTGETLELKTDFHDTTNFFMERFSDMEKKTPGGPWQAASKGITWFVVFFPKSGLWHIFKTSELEKFLAANKKQFREVKIFNHRWVTLGYVVPKASLTQLEYRLDIKLKRAS